MLRFHALATATARSLLNMLITLSSLFEKYNMRVNGAIHIGAHYGEEVPEYINHGIDKIALFEPICDNYQQLLINVENLPADIQTYQTALGANQGVATMYKSNNEAQSSSILKPKNHLSHHPDVLFNEQEIVSVETLDSYLLNGFNFINIDVQGYELEVFKGSARTLEAIDYVYCEVNRGEVYEGNALIEDLDSYLSKFGLSRKETYWPADWYQWGDAFYCKHD